MNITRYDPWQTMEQWRREMDRMFNLPVLRDDTSHLETGDWSPAVDIKEDDDRYLVHADIPGVDPADIEVTTENGVLSIRGERRHESEEEKENYRRIERARGVFLRRFTLPDNTDPENITATGSNGVLEISIPKTEKKEAKRIDVSG